MLSGEQLLEGAANNGSLDPNEWPRALEFLLARLNHIVHHEFPIPTIPPPQPSRTHSTTPSKPETQLGSSQDSQSANKENAPPQAPATPPRPSPQATEQNTPQLQADGEQGGEANIPAELRELYSSISGTLSRNFPVQPPHTVQRLSELILWPKRHYRFLPAYLRALDRVVCVSSTTTVFPLPQAVVPASSGILNGVGPSGGVNPAAVLGSDESLGGALLTPIPWLRSDRERGGDSAGSNGAHNQSELVSESTEMVDGPNGAGRIETVSVINGVLGSTTASPSSSSATSTSSPAVATPSSLSPSDGLREQGAVTQGELLRQEQEAGVVPVGQTTPRRGLLSTAAATGGSAEPQADAPPNPDDEPPEEHPHARGPEVIGAEDMGPQDRRLGGAIDLEAAVGRPAVKSEEEKEREREREAEEKEEAMDDAEPKAEHEEEGRTAKRVKREEAKSEQDAKMEGEESKEAGDDSSMADAPEGE